MKKQILCFILLLASLNTFAAEGYKSLFAQAEKMINSLSHDKIQGPLKKISKDPAEILSDKEFFSIHVNGSPVINAIKTKSGSKLVLQGRYTKLNWNGENTISSLSIAFIPKIDGVDKARNAAVRQKKYEAFSNKVNDLLERNGFDSLPTPDNRNNIGMIHIDAEEVDQMDIKEIKALLNDLSNL